MGWWGEVGGGVGGGIRGIDWNGGGGGAQTGNYFQIKGPHHGILHI